MLIALWILPPRGALAGEERLQGAGDRADAEASLPGLLSIDANVDPPVTRLGMNLLEVVPSPSWPEAFKPQQ